MSHVDEGMLTAYVDGALAPAEREAIATHLAHCADCRSREAEARQLAGRAHEILMVATPRSRSTPSFDDVVARSRVLVPMPRRRMRLTTMGWAASLALAAGAGWFARGRLQHAPNSEEPTVAAAPSPTPPPAGAPDSVTRAAARRQDVAMNSAPAAKTAQDHAEVRQPAAQARDTLVVPPAGGLAIQAMPAPASPKPVVSLDRALADSRARQTADLGGAGHAAGASGEAMAAAAPVAAMRRAESPMAPPGRVLTVAGLEVLRGPAPNAGGGLETIQRLDASHDLVLVQERLAANAPMAKATDSLAVMPGRVARLRSDSMTTVTVLRDGHRITARAAIPADSLRALLERLR